MQCKVVLYHKKYFYFINFALINCMVHVADLIRNLRYTYTKGIFSCGIGNAHTFTVLYIMCLHKPYIYLTCMHTWIIYAIASATSHACKPLDCIFIQCTKIMLKTLSGDNSLFCC